MSQPQNLKEVEIVTKRTDLPPIQKKPKLTQTIPLTSNDNLMGKSNKNGQIQSNSQDKVVKMGDSRVNGDSKEGKSNFGDMLKKNKNQSNKSKYQQLQKDTNADAQKELEQEKKSIFEDDTVKSSFPKLEAILESTIFQIILTILTVYALFGDDVRVITTTKSSDGYFDVITIVSMALFIVEIILSMLSKIGYSFSFYFWLDLISTVSLVLDIQIISQNLFYSSGASNAASIQQAGKASRVGTRAGRVVRLVRLIRIVKLYKASQDAKERRQEVAKQKYAQRKKLKKMKQNPNAFKEEEEEVKQKYCLCFVRKEKKKVIKQKEPVKKEANTKKNPVHFVRDPVTKRMSIIRDPNKEGQNNSQDKNKAPEGGQQRQGTNSQVQEKEKQKKEMQKESRVSQVLSARTTKRVIIIVLTLLFLMPLFSVTYFYDYPYAVDESMSFMQKWAETEGSSFQDLEGLFNQIKELFPKGNENMFVAYLSTPFSELFYQMDDFDELRNDEQQSGIYYLDKEKYIELHKNDPSEASRIAEIQNYEDESEELAFYGIFSQRKINVFTACLSLGRTFFICIVLTCGALYFSSDANKLALGPIESMIVKLTRISRNPISAREEVQIQENADENETKLIENAVVKISSLLALGFGEAGSKIIGTNISQGGDVDPMLPGYKLMAIYGFCDIRQFTDTTEVLQEDIMIFVNYIGEIVHGYTDRYQGAGNKNIGDAFLLVWRINEDKYILSQNNEVVYKDYKYINILCDMALTCFIRIHVKLNREPKILQYRTHQGLNKRMPNYKIKLGFGLHLGWGIEGAIGSEFKIDASYLSPHVNMAGKLEAATKGYGVPILISSAIQELCTPQMKRYTRQVDRVKVQGLTAPIGLFTVDMNIENLPESKNQSENGLSPEDQKEYLIFKKRDLFLQLNYWEEDDDFEYEPWNAEEQVQQKKDLRLALENWDEKFQNLFAEGFQMYLRGNWSAAVNKFEYILKLDEYSKDGPTKNLLNYMKTFNNKTPQDWPGYRPFSE